MQFHLIHIVAFFTLALVASHPSLAPEQYWNSVLPNTPMPKAISDLLQQAYAEDKSTSVNTGKRTNIVGVGKGVASPVIFIDYYRPPGPPPGATEDELRDVSAVTVFFLEKDVHPGTAMNLYFDENTNKATLLPRHAANSIPFSSNKLPEIFNHFSVKAGSVEAEIMQATIKDCERPAIKGEYKYCATSLESMIDFSTSKLGKNVQAISTEVDGKTQLQEYRITAGVTKMKSDKSVVCHKLNYAYVVFYCHVIQKTDSYVVRLKGADGTKANAVAVCHKDTSSWNPKHLAFQLLKVKPGTVPICHFLSEDQIA